MPTFKAIMTNVLRDAMQRVQQSDLNLPERVDAYAALEDIAEALNLVEIVDESDEQLEMRL